MEVTITQAKAKLESLIKRATAGEEIIITRAGIPLVRLESVRPLGMYRGKIKIADDFDAPLPDEILAGFLGEDVHRPKQRKR